MLADPTQLGYILDKDKALIQARFKDNLSAYALRNLFWQIELSEDEKSLLEFSEEELKLIRKIMLPEISGDIPLGQQVDLASNALLEQINLMSPASALTMIDANDLRIKYLEQQFRKLESKEFDLEEGDIVLRELREKQRDYQDEERHINMIAYKSIAQYIDGKINTFVVFANPSVELTPEQQKERDEKNSTQ